MQRTKIGTVFSAFLLWNSLTFAESKNFNDLFRLESEIKLEQTKNDSIGNPWFGLAVNRDGKIWLADFEESQRNVKIYSPQGALLRVSDLKNLKEYKDNHPYRVIPTDVAFDEDNRAYVLSLAGHIIVTDSVGKFLNYFATEQNLDCRGGWTIKIDTEGNVYIGGPCYQEIDICPETRDFCIHKYDSKGKYVKSFFPFEKRLFELTTIPGSGVYFDFDPDRNIWCIHQMIYQIFKYSPEGKLIQKFPGKSTQYKPPTKFKEKIPIFLTRKSQKARRAWWNSWTQITKLFVLEPNLILLSLHTHSPSEYVVEIYDQEGNVLATGIQTDHRLLGKDEDGFLYFLLDGKEEKASREYRIGKFSLNLSTVSKTEKQ